MRLFMIFIALVLAVAAGFGFWYASSGDSSVVQNAPGAPEVAVQEVSVLVARRDIPIGHKITADDLDRQSWPSTLVLQDFVQEGNEAQLIDRVARSSFKERQPIMLSLLANPNDPGFLAAQLGEGKRAVTIAIDDVSGISGFIFPGDHVDVITKHRVGLNQDYDDGTERATAPDANGKLNPKPAVSAQPLPLARTYSVPTLLKPSKLSNQPVLNVTEVLIANARVLAVGTISAQYVQDKAAPRTITLEVDELQAQKLRHANRDSLTLALRSLKDSEDKTIPRPVGDSDMSRIIPPAYFPHLYDGGDYKSEVVTPEVIDYEAPQAEEEDEGTTVTIIRGVKKEIVGVNRP
ncbi:MAG: Flp pilus assembly protein CpaB [Alphaproteobacteria bacterium]|nr:Flp pilus assembly protein CpaB [Alphaproteobacteria bacterium]